MNLSWNAVESIARFYKISPKDILVLHDEIELPLGKIALKPWGGAAGHNGLRSITTKLGTPDYTRLRIGVGKSDNIGVAEYVLQKFKPNEINILAEKEEEIFAMVKDFLAK
jgi:PTH1 family peptidyl-tRNA hydrolase